METKAKCILAIVAMCLLITPAFSQGGERDGHSGNPGSNMGPAQDNAMMPGTDGAPFGHAPDAPKFKGCNTAPLKMFAKEPIKPPSDKPDGLGNGLGPQGVPPQDGPHGEPAPWSYIEPGDGKHDGAAFGFAGHDGQFPHRSIMGLDHPRDPPKKSMMEKKHEVKHEKKFKKDLRHLWHNNLPEMPPMKSIMDHGR